MFSFFLSLVQMKVNQIYFEISFLSSLYMIAHFDNTFFFFLILTTWQMNCLSSQSLVIIKGDSPCIKGNTKEICPETEK